MKVLILIHSIHGHILKMAHAVKKGAEEIEGSEVVLKRVPETLPQEMLENIGAKETFAEIEKIPVANPNELANYDAILFGTPTRFGNMSGQMRNFMDQTGELWMKNSLVGKVGSVFTGSGTQHGGQESTILSFHVTLLHLGMLVAGLPYTYPGLQYVDEISGGSPYGASTIAGPRGSRQPSENELNGAKFQGKYVAEIAGKLKD